MSHDVDQPRKLSWGEKREQRDTMNAQLVDEFRRFMNTFTEFAARFQPGKAVNDVLEVGTFALPAAPGYVQFDWPMAAGSVELGNLGANAMTVVAAGPSPDGTAPAVGRGVYVVPAGACRVVNVASHTVTVYGTATQTFTLQASTRGGFISAGLVGVNGGGV